MITLNKVPPTKTCVINNSLLLIIAILFFSFTSANQTLLPIKTDYLKRIEEKSPIPSKVKLALEAGDYFFYSNQSEEAKHFYQLAVELSAPIKYSTLYAKALVKVADFEPNDNRARFQYIEAKEIFAEHNDKENLALTLERIAFTYDYSKLEREIAIDFLNQALNIRKILPYSDQLTETMRTLAWLYHLNEESKKTERLYQEAIDLDLYNLGIDDIRVVLALERFAIYLINNKQYDKALNVLHRKLSLHKQSKYPDIYNIGRTQSMIGWCYLQLSQSARAERYYIAALKNINRSITKDEEIPHYYSLPALFDLVYLYISKGEYTEADHYFVTASEILKQAGEEEILQYLYNAANHNQNSNTEVIAGFPWSLDAQIIGAQTMIDYQKYMKETE